MDVDAFDWDEEDFDRGNTRHILSAGYDIGDIEDAIADHRGHIGRTHDTDLPTIVADIDGQATRIVFEVIIDRVVDYVVIRPVTAFPVED